ncbi:MAG: plasmid pRiA4b ORF-3 family protein [Actinomycetota bacterium]|nr:plasmid pRiA4b ORF-3 family protein [Actinomycetota bacterium]
MTSRGAIEAWLASSGMPDLATLADSVSTGRAAPARLATVSSRHGELPEAEEEVSVLRVRVDLDGARPPVWRRLDLRSDLTVTQLHEVLQAAMGWLDGHLHRFWVGPTKQLWTGPHLINDHDQNDEDFQEDDGGRTVGHEDAVEVGQLLRKTGDRLFYTYDFGDGWDHTLTVESTAPADDDQAPAVCLGGRRACPLEDSGGVGSHNELVAAYAAGTGYEPPYDEWVPPNWDPTHLAVEQVNVMLSLIGKGADEIVDAFEAAIGPQRHPSVDDLVQRADPRDVPTLTRLTTAALTGDAPPETAQRAGPRTIGALATRGAVRPWQVMLSVAGAEGIPLTSAGWMRPAAVKSIYQALRLEESWIGKGNREDLTPPVAELRQQVVAAGLLRKYRGRLVLTRLGRQVDGDASAIWEALAARLIPRGDVPFVRACTALLLLHVAAGWPAGGATLDDVARLLTRAGWATRDGYPVNAGRVADAVNTVHDHLARLEGRERPTPWGQSTPTQRAMARAALFPS